jgi:hypothetical protein
MPTMPQYDRAASDAEADAEAESLPPYRVGQSACASVEEGEGSAAGVGTAWIRAKLLWDFGWHGPRMKTSENGGAGPGPFSGVWGRLAGLRMAGQ